MFVGAGGKSLCGANGGNGGRPGLVSVSFGFFSSSVLCNKADDV